MSRSGLIELDFGPERQAFRLGIKQWDRLDEELEVGPSVLAARLSLMEAQSLEVLKVFPLLSAEVGRFRHKDVRAVCYQGLVGAGMKPDEAGRVVRGVEEDGGVIALIPTAWTVVWAGMGGVAVEQPAGERPGAETARPHSPTAGSGSDKMGSTP